MNAVQPTEESLKRLIMAKKAKVVEKASSRSGDLSKMTVVALDDLIALYTTALAALQLERSKR